MLLTKLLLKCIKTASILFAANFLLGIFITLPGLAMEVVDDQEKVIFHPFNIADTTDIIIRGNPKGFAEVSRDYHAYVCKKGFIMMYIGKHKVDKYRHGFNVYRIKSPIKYSREYYKWTEQEELILLQSLMNDKRQISKIDAYILPCPPLRVSDYHTNAVIDLLHNPEIPIRELELWHTFNADVIETEFFKEQRHALLSRETIFHLIAASISQEIEREAEGQEQTREWAKSIFETKVSPLYLVEREKYIKSDILKKMLTLLDAIKNHDKLQVLKVYCDGLDLIEDEWLETLGKNSILTSLSINPIQIPPFWRGENKLIDYLSTNKTLKNLKLKNVLASFLTQKQFNTLNNTSILTSMSIDATSGLFDDKKIEMVQNYLLTSKTLKKFTIKRLDFEKENHKNFTTACANICKPKNIRLKVPGYSFDMS